MQGSPLQGFPFFPYVSVKATQQTQVRTPCIGVSSQWTPHVMIHRKVYRAVGVAWEQAGPVRTHLLALAEWAVHLMYLA